MNQAQGKSAFFLRDFAQADQPGGVRRNDVVPVIAHARVDLARMRLAHGGAKHSQVFAGQESNPTADPVSRIKRANHAGAGSNAVLIQCRGFVTSGEIQLLVRKVNPLGPAGGSGGFKNQFGLAAQKFLRGQRPQVLGGGEDVAQILGAADAFRVNTMFAQFAREELLVLRGVTHDLDKRIRLNPPNHRGGNVFAPTHQRRHGIADQRAFKEFAGLTEHHLSVRQCR